MEVDGVPDGLPRSIFVTDDAPVHDVPMSVIKRPLPSALDEGKVVQFMQNIQVIAEPYLHVSVARRGTITNAAAACRMART